MKSIYKCKSCGHTELYDNGAVRCARCGGFVVKIVDGNKKMMDIIKKVSIYAEGVLTVPLFLAIGKLGSDPYSIVEVVVISAAMTALLPLTVGVARKAKRENES